jgi:hypothetical protein
MACFWFSVQDFLHFINTFLHSLPLVVIIIIYLAESEKSFIYYNVDKYRNYIGNLTPFN